MQTDHLGNIWGANSFSNNQHCPSSVSKHGVNYKIRTRTKLPEASNRDYTKIPIIKFIIKISNYQND